MGKRKPAGARILAFPSAPKLDVRAALLDNQSSPTVQRPRELDAEIDARARELAEEAFELCREHLRRRVAHTSESGWPRKLNLDSARKVIQEGSLGDALAREYRSKLEQITFSARLTAKLGAQLAEESAQLADEIERAVSAREK